MKAWRLYEPGGPEALVLEDLPRPRPTADQVVIEVRAFGLNRSEWFTRIGDSPTVRLPRVLGIECAGTVVSAPGGQFEPGQTVCAMMGGMGREFDGSYAEYTCVPRSSVFPIQTDLPWEILGALPEMFQTCHGSLHTGLGAKPGETLLIRGGTSSIGLTTLAMAKRIGLNVLTTLLDSLQCARSGGVVCMTGILGGEWELASFRPMGQIPTGVRLTSYSGGASDISPDALQQYVTMVERGELEIRQGPTWEFDQLQEAHRSMDENRANGKMVVVVGNI
jgi:NADPH:quinone reductase-like Zn-dependent oxidoreductase